MKEFIFGLVALVLMLVAKIYFLNSDVDRLSGLLDEQRIKTFDADHNLRVCKGSLDVQSSSIRLLEESSKRARAEFERLQEEARKVSDSQGDLIDDIRRADVIQTCDEARLFLITDAFNL